MDTFFELFYYIGIITIVSLLNIQEPVSAANLTESQGVIQQYQFSREFPLKEAGQYAMRLSECE